MKGTIAVDELIVPIVDIYLDHGMIHFVARVAGPFPGCTAAAYTVYDRGGRVVFRTRPGIGGLTWGPITAYGFLTVDAPLSIHEAMADPTGQPHPGGRSLTA